MPKTIDDYCKLFNCNDLAEHDLVIKGNNVIGTPSYFYIQDKWPGCLPRPLYQGTCGSCWGFASVTCLSSRFYIETCGISGCNNYPQINNGSINQIYGNIYDNYRFHKVYLQSIVDYIDINKDKIISKDEWMTVVTDLRSKVYDSSTNFKDKYKFVQILVYMLDFQSLGSINLEDKNAVTERANKTYDTWKKLVSVYNDKSSSMNNDDFTIQSLQKRWMDEPISLSAEKLIACCIQCMHIDFKQQNSKNKVLKSEGQVLENPLCAGGSLEDAWVLLRDIGTTTSQCIGYNMDNYSEGDQVPSCRDLQGPFYSFCSGYIFDKTKDRTELRNAIEDLEKSGLDPVTMSYNSDLPWIDPQLFRFRAKNAYKLPNDMKTIQKEIIERGPVTSGFVVYADFQYDFGSDKMGGQKYTKGMNPIGNLIYMHVDKKGSGSGSTGSGSDDVYGGHAITIVGWGTYHHTENGKLYKIPYWICLNSWGADWGHSGFPDYSDRNGLPKHMDGGGFFWIIRSINNCQIEENVVVGQPDLENITYPGVMDRYGWGLPGPLIESKYFLDPLDLSSVSVGSNGGKLIIEKQVEGGGAYVDNVGGNWEIKSMKSPSPYVLFWPDNRPVYSITKILNDLDSDPKDNIIHLDQDSIKKLIAIMKVQSNPILLLGTGDDKEQIQLINLHDNYITVKRAVNNNDISVHIKGTTLNIFPYQKLDNDFLSRVTEAM
jgi:hypothetical protein